MSDERMDGGRVVAAALAWVGTPYRHQGARRRVGCDCLGLVRGVWRDLYGDEPERPGAYAPDWAEAGGEDRLLAAARRHLVATDADAPFAGAVLLFRWRPHLPAKHAAIALGADRFVHAYERRAVTVSFLVPQWRRRIAGIFAFPAWAPSTPLDIG
jgi:NlpC/P60 family putative phage cell wall peptidase